MTILAAAFTIAFEGLMLFQGETSGARHVAVVNAMYHDRPRIYIYRAGNAPDHALDLVKRVAIDLNDDDRVAFLNVPRGEITTDDFYARHVPHFSDFILRGDVDDDIVDEKTNTGVRAFVDLPSGDMTTYRTFKERVELGDRNSAITRTCFARFVVLETSNPVAPVFMTIIHNPPRPLPGRPTPPSIDYYPIQAYDLVIVSNTSDDYAHLHFPEYRKLLNGNGKLGSVKVLDYDFCDTTEGSLMISKAVRTALDSHNPAPNGDCGPTGNP